MAKKRGNSNIGKASKACPMISPKTGKRIRTKAERKRCMQRAMPGGKSGKKKSSGRKKKK